MSNSFLMLFSFALFLFLSQSRLLFVTPEITQLREQTRRLINNEKIQYHVYNFSKIVYNFNKKIDPLNYLHRLTTTPSEAFKSAGQILAEDVDKLFEGNFENRKGNLREYMTLIYNFAFNSCDLFWSMVEKIYNKENLSEIIELGIDVNFIKKTLIPQIERFTGLQISDFLDIQINETKAVQNKQGYPTFCHLLTSNFDGSVYSSRNLQPSIRNRRNITLFGRFRIMNLDVYPNLSENELKAVQIGAPNYKNSSFEFLPWETGYVLYTVDQENVFSKVAKKFKKLQIAGPSGSTDILIRVGLMFGFNVKDLVLGCLAYMGNPPDHSFHEMLLAAKNFGLQYSVSEDEYEFVHRLANSMK